jgi:hypothetical protein
MYVSDKHDNQYVDKAYSQFVNMTMIMVVVISCLFRSSAQIKHSTEKQSNATLRFNSISQSSMIHERNMMSRNHIPRGIE